jgi:hypothetical protein
MARFSSAVAVALAAAIDPADRKNYCHSVKLEVPIVRSACSAPKLVQKLLQQLKSDETDISFRGASLDANDTELFPADKPTFDTLFLSYSMKKDKWEIRGSQLRNPIGSAFTPHQRISVDYAGR